jgi:uncharacterized protein with HEPN domain
MTGEEHGSGRRPFTLKSSRDFLEDIVAEARFLLDQSLGLSLEDFLADEVRKRAFARSLEIIGEAVKGLPNDVILRHPEVPWRRIMGMRDRLIHGYFAVDYALVHDVVISKIPDLHVSASKILIEDELTTE